MVAKMKNDKNSLALLSSKRTKADTKTRADEAFALPSFPETTVPFHMEVCSQSSKEVSMEHHHGKDLENMKQTMLQHEAMFKEQVCELHRLYQVQRLLMAASKGKIVSTPSDPVSSSSSLVNSSEHMKPAGDRGPLEAVSGSKINSTQKHQDSVPMPGQFPPLDPKTRVNSAQEGVQHLDFYNLKSDKSEPRRRTFDLERPAEEYIDVDYGEEKLAEGNNLPKISCESNVSCPVVSLSSLSVKDVHWSSSMGFERDTVGNVCRGPINKHDKLADENEGENHFIFQYPGLGGVSSFSMVPSRLDCPPSQEALAFPTPVLHTKSLFGGWQEQKHEGLSEDQLMSAMYCKQSAECKKRREERRFPELEFDQGTRNEISTLPKWLLQGHAHPVKAVSSQALTQTSPLPFPLHKQDDVDLARKHSVILEESGSPSVSQERFKEGNAWCNNGMSFHQGQMHAMGLQGISSSGLSTTGGNMHMPYGMFPQVGDSSSRSIPVIRDDKGAHVFPAFMSNYPSVPAVDMTGPGFGTHATSMMFPLGFSSRDSTHFPSTQPWFQQNDLCFSMQQQQMAKLKPASLPLAGERSLTGDCKLEETHSLGLATIFGRDLHGLSNVNDDASGSIMQSGPLTASPEVPSKRNIVGNKSSTTDVELTLGLCTNEAKRDPPCFGKLTVKQEHFDKLPFSGESSERKAQMGKIQPREIDCLFSESCAENAKIRATHNCFERGIETSQSSIPHEACSINVLKLGLSQKETDAVLRKQKKMPSPDTAKIEQALHQQKQDESASPNLPKALASQKQGQSWYHNAVEDPREQLSTFDELKIVSLLDKDNDGNNRNERAVNQHRQWNVSVAEGCSSGVAADKIFGRASPEGEIIVPCKSLDVPTVESCEVREDVHPEFCNPISKANLGFREASQKLESAPGHCEGVILAPSPRMQTAAEGCVQADILVQNQCDTFASPTICSSLAVYKSDTENDTLGAQRPDNFCDRESNNSTRHQNEVLDNSKQAAEVLLSLACDLSSVLQKKATEDYAVHKQKRSLEWFANVIPREDESGIILANEDAASSFQPVETNEQLGEGTPGNSEIVVEDRLKKVQSPKKLDFFEAVTLMLKASGLDTDGVNLQDLDRWQIEGECQPVSAHSGRSSRRGRVGKDFQREMLPSIASLSRHEITEDIQMLGGLVRSAAEIVAKSSASSLPFKDEDSLNLVTKSSKKDETEHQNGFLRISSRGDLTRRRRVRRHRSRWSLLPLGIGIRSA